MNYSDMVSYSSRILIIRSNPVAPDPRVEKEARALVEAGYEVQVVGWDRSASHPAHEKKEGYQIHRMPIRSQYGMGLGNLPKLAAWQVRLLLWLLAHRRGYDALHACDFDTVIPCLVMKLAFGKKLIYDIFDFYPDHLRNTPAWIKRAIRKLDYWIINHADGVILVDDTRREQIKETSPRRLFVIYNSPQDTAIQYPNYNPSAKGKLHLAYVGLFQKERGLLEVASLLKKHPEWTLDMAGFGGDEEAIRTACSDVPNINWHGRVDYEKALQLSSQADVLFATYDPSIPNHRYSSPNKLFEAMMLAKPIVVARNTNMDTMIADNNCGLVVVYGDVNELEQAFITLADNPTLREQLGRNARKAYDTTYKWGIMKHRLQELYAQVLNG
jgi:glycosyltransferase involved in cell wall biosynthesis